MQQAVWFEKNFGKEFTPFAQQVVDWNLKAKGKHDTSLKAINNQYKLIEEEFMETIKAFTEYDKVEFLDGLCDLFVVCSYADYLEGYKDYKRTNGGKIDLSWYIHQHLSDDTSWETGKAISPVQSIMQRMNTAMSLISQDDKREGAGLLLSEVMNLLLTIDADWKGALQNVLRSNNSKFDRYFEGNDEYYQSHCDMYETAGRYKGVTHMIEDGFVIYRDENGKVLKGIGYDAPQLEEFIYA